jgi:ribosomal protein L14
MNTTVTLKRGTRVRSRKDADLTGTVVRTEANVYGTDPGVHVRWDDNTRLVDHTRELEAIA